MGSSATPDDEQSVARKVAEAVAAIADPRLASALGLRLRPPTRCSLGWDYGPVEQGAEAIAYPAFVVADFSPSDVAIAYSGHGFGPSHPWGLISLTTLRCGPDGAWHASLEAAFRESPGWNEVPPAGYEVD